MMMLLAAKDNAVRIYCYLLFECCVEALFGHIIVLVTTDRMILLFLLLAAAVGTPSVQTYDVMDILPQALILHAFSFIMCTVNNSLPERNLLLRVHIGL